MADPTTLAESQFQAMLAAVVTDWPIRWANGAWPSGTLLSDGNLPIDADGAPAPFIEAQIISNGEHLGAIGASTDGRRTSVLAGLLRAYLCVGQGTGTALITAKGDALSAALRRIVHRIDADTKLVTADPRLDDGVAAYEEANRFVRQFSLPFDLHFRA